MKIGIGIDTGGTYTDTVAFDFENKKILGTSKALTTKEDLSIGILEALDKLPSDLVKQAEVISLSTTLATNACVEDRGGNAKLIFFGGNRKIIDDNGEKYGLPPVDQIYVQESYTHFSGEIDREPDWDKYGASLDTEFDDLDGAGIVELYAIRNSAVVEKKAKELFQQKHDIPVVCGHELFSNLNSLQRASSTLLNARLFPIIKEFIGAIKTAMAKRGIEATIVIVRSDGSLMSESFAHTRPVETLLCGPAASVMGGAKLTDEKDSIIVDMGGTTTDIALIKGGIPFSAIGGVSIGKWKTFVSGLYIKTIGLGGDTAVHYTGQKVFLEDYRVVPLCVAADKYPEIIENLKKLLRSTKKHTIYLHEHYILIRDISGSARYSDEEKAFCNQLKDLAVIHRDAAALWPGKDIYNLDVERLIKDGVVMRCGFTPTDAMHIKGDYTAYSEEASLLAANYIASNARISVDELCDLVYDEVRRKIYVNIVKVILENKDRSYLKNGVGSEIDTLINKSYKFSSASVNDGLISSMFKTDFTLIGVGAPIHVFLYDVAQKLGTKAVLPPHYEVANALGAIAGNILASCIVEIKPNYDGGGVTGYTVFGSSRTKSFKDAEEAKEFAVSDACSHSRREAVLRGASGEITTTYTLDEHEAELKDGVIYLGTYVIAQSVGSIGF